MQTLHTVLKRGGLVWVQDDVPPSVFPPRLARVQEAVAAAGHDAWLVYGDAYRYGDVAYLTHFLPRVRGVLLLVPRAGEPTLLVAVGSRDIPAAKTLTCVEDVRPYTRLPGDAVKLIRERGLADKRLGLVGVEELMAVGDWEQIQADLPDARWEPAGDALARLRAAKEPTELAVLRQAAAIVQDALHAAAEALRPGLTERELLAVVDRAMRRARAEDARCLIASGPRASLSLRPPDDRALEPGDVVLLHLAAEYQRYWAESGQTFALGAADADTRALADAAQRAVEAMARAARPGIPASALADAAQSALADVQPLLSTQHSALSASYGLGHGVGLDVEEPPAVRPGEAAPLSAGRVLALHVVLHGRDGRGALAEQTIVLDADGARPLLAELIPALTERR
jgi:Xaa-Pro aminopeptidase